MNSKAFLLIVAVAVGGTGTASGQFLKKLGRKVERAAERTVERRAERETEKRTDQALDKVLEPGDGKGKKKERVGSGGMDNVPDTYTFSFRSTMKIIDESKREETEIFYWMEPEAAYFGTQLVTDGTTNQVAVMDTDIEGMVMFMDDGKQKTAMHLIGNQQLMGNVMRKVPEKGLEDVTVTPIEDKTVLGYRCKGFQMETDEGVSRIWVTDEAPVGLINGMLHDGYVPKGLPDFGPNTLFMEMEYVPTGRNGSAVRMVCTELKPISMSIRKEDYQAIMSPLFNH